MPPVVDERRTTVGELLGGTFAELAAIRRELAIYFGVFLVAGIVAGLELPFMWVVSIMAFVGYFVGQYMLYRAMLERAGMAYDQRTKVPGFFLMAVVLGMPLYVAFALLVVPGIILGAKWVMAPTFYVAREENPFEAIGRSWKASGHNTVHLSLAFAALLLLWLAVFMLLSSLSAAASTTFGVSALAWLGIHLLPVLLMGLSMAAYRRLSDEVSSLEDIFA